MQRAKGFVTGLAGLLAICAALALCTSPAAAQNMGSVSGEVKDINGKPYPDVTVVLKGEESGLTYTLKTDRSGRFVQIGMKPGIYSVKFSVKDQVGYETNVRVSAGEEAKLDVNFKDIFAKQSAEQQEQRKKAEEERKKFEGMKAHFDAGKAAMDQAKQVRDEMMKLPQDQRAPMQEKLSALYQTAITEFEESQKAASEKDPNLHIVYYNLASAYDAAGKNDEAVAAYQKAIELKPTEAGYYNNLGNVYARLGKVSEAGQAYEKSATLDPTNAASVWLNFGIVLYNANRLKEAADPLRKATTQNPKNADAWYLLGASLLASIETKQVGDKLNYIVPPGTTDAYQKYLEIAPNGRFAADAKAALQSLEALGAGVETKVKVTKKKG